MTVSGETRASVDLRELETLWFNTGSLCNLECAHCYMGSGPRNGGLQYMTLADVERFLDEATTTFGSTRMIGFTGGEPFMAPEIVSMIEASLEGGFQVLVLTNAMKPMMRHAREIRRLGRRYGQRLTIRVSLDHYSRGFHDMERGPGSWDAATRGLQWLAESGVRATVAGRARWNESDQSLRAGYRKLFERLEVDVDARSPEELVLFPELSARDGVPEISENCWGILGVSPGDLMCARSRMVIRRAGAPAPTVTACTLLPWARDFDMGTTLEEASGPVWLNHPFCARFCVLGGGSCTPGGNEA